MYIYVLVYWLGFHTDFRLSPFRLSPLRLHSHEGDERTGSEGHEGHESDGDSEGHEGHESDGDSEGEMDSPQRQQFCPHFLASGSDWQHLDQD